MIRALARNAAAAAWPLWGVDIQPGLHLIGFGHTRSIHRIDEEPYGGYKNAAERRFAKSRANELMGYDIFEFTDFWSLEPDSTDSRIKRRCRLISVLQLREEHPDTQFFEMDRLDTPISFQTKHARGKGF